MNSPNIDYAINQICGHIRSEWEKAPPAIPLKELADRKQLFVGLEGFALRQALLAHRNGYMPHLILFVDNRGRVVSFNSESFFVDDVSRAILERIAPILGEQLSELRAVMVVNEAWVSKIKKEDYDAGKAPRSPSQDPNRESALYLSLQTVEGMVIRIYAYEDGNLGDRLDSEFNSDDELQSESRYDFFAKRRPASLHA